MKEKTASARIGSLVEEGMTYAQAYKVTFPAALEKEASVPGTPDPIKAPRSPTKIELAQGGGKMPDAKPKVVGFQKSIKPAPIPKAPIRAKLAEALQKEAAKPTFSPAMDESPALKGGQSRLPDKVQAAILKKKLGKKKRKTASISKEAILLEGLLGGGFGAAHAKKKGRPAMEGALKGAGGTIGGALAGGIPAGVLAGRTGNRNLAIISALLGSTAGGVGGYKAMMSTIKKKKNRKRKTASVHGDGHKLTTLPPLKTNPLMIAQEEGYPVAGIKHNRGFVGLAGLPKADSPPYKMEPHQKYASALMVSGLMHASSSLYDAYCDTGLEKTAILGAIKGALNLGTGAGKAAGWGAAIAGLGGMGVKGKSLYGLIKGPQAARNKVIQEAGMIRARRKPGEILSGKDAEILRQDKLLSRVGNNPTLKNNPNFADAPMEYLKELGPDVLRHGAQTGAIGAIAGAAGKAGHNLMRRRKMISTAKAMAIPAAVGLGGYALLKD